VLAAGGPRTSAGRAGLERLDTALRDPRNRRNPGTTADLTAAALLVVILEPGTPDARAVAAHDTADERR
jgi:triphosphoribosyl-dephospho-CoA synthetase